VSRLSKAGAEAWWFDGDRGAAHTAWQQENVKGGRRFDDGKWKEVVDIIDNNYALIAEFYGPRMLRTVEAGPSHLAEEEIFGAMFSQPTCPPAVSAVTVRVEPAAAVTPARVVPGIRYRRLALISSRRPRSGWHSS
jgi:hypothetical protein